MIANALDIYASHTEVLTFVAAFARAEFALKEMGYVKADGTKKAKPSRPAFPGRATADWTPLAKDVATEFDAALALQPKRKVRVQYLIDQPPQQQVFVPAAGTSSPGWRWDPWTPAGTTTAAKACAAMKQVRNNLFHGGKDLSQRLLRDLKLVDSSLAVLQLLLELSPEFNRHFRPPP